MAFLHDPFKQKWVKSENVGEHLSDGWQPVMSHKKYYMGVDMAATHASSKTQIFGMSEDFLIELHGLMEIADIKEEDVLKAMRNIAKVKREEVPF